MRLVDQKLGRLYRPLRNVIYICSLYTVDQCFHNSTQCKALRRQLAKAMALDTYEKRLDYYNCMTTVYNTDHYLAINSAVLREMCCIILHVSPAAYHTRLSAHACHALQAGILLDRQVHSYGSYVCVMPTYRAVPRLPAIVPACLPPVLSYQDHAWCRAAYACLPGSLHSGPSYRERGRNGRGEEGR